MRVATVSRDFFGVLGVQASLGRGFTAEDARVGADAGRRRQPPVLDAVAGIPRSPGGHSPTHRRRAYTVVGVMPIGFQFPAMADLWLPAELNAPRTSRTAHNYAAVGRLRDGVSAAQATADLSAIAQDIIRQSAEKSDYLMRDAAAVPLQSCGRRSR